MLVSTLLISNPSVILASMIHISAFQIRHFQYSRDHYANNFRFIKLIASKCKNTTTKKNCKPSSDIDSYVLKHKVQLTSIILTSYFDFINYKKPIQDYLNDIFYWSFIPSYTKVAKINLKKNDLKLSDSLLSGFTSSVHDYIFQQITSEKHLNQWMIIITLLFFSNLIDNMINILERFTD